MAKRQASRNRKKQVIWTRDVGDVIRTRYRLSFLTLLVLILGIFLVAFFAGTQSSGIFQTQPKAFFGIGGFKVRLFSAPTPTKAPEPNEGCGSNCNTVCAGCPDKPECKNWCDPKNNPPTCGQGPGGSGWTGPNCDRACAMNPNQAGCKNPDGTGFCDTHPQDCSQPAPQGGQYAPNPGGCPGPNCQACNCSLNYAPGSGCYTQCGQDTGGGNTKPNPQGGNCGDHCKCPGPNCDVVCAQDHCHAGCADHGNPDKGC